MTQTARLISSFFIALGATAFIYSAHLGLSNLAKAIRLSETADLLYELADYWVALSLIIGVYVFAISVRESFSSSGDPADPKVLDKAIAISMPIFATFVLLVLILLAGRILALFINERSAMLIFLVTLGGYVVYLFFSDATFKKKSK